MKCISLAKNSPRALYANLTNHIPCHAYFSFDLHDINFTKCNKHKQFYDIFVRILNEQNLKYTASEFHIVRGRELTTESTLF